MLKFTLPSAKKLPYLFFFIVVLILSGEVVYYLGIKETWETKGSPILTLSEQTSPFSLYSRRGDRRPKGRRYRNVFGLTSPARPGINASHPVLSTGGPT